MTADFIPADKQALIETIIETGKVTDAQLVLARKLLGLNAGEMADRLGVARNTYGKWERGERQMPAIGVTAVKWLLADRIL